LRRFLVFRELLSVFLLGGKRRAKLQRVRRKLKQRQVTGVTR